MPRFGIFQESVQNEVVFLKKSMLSLAVVPSSFKFKTMGLCAPPIEGVLPNYSTQKRGLLV